MALPSYTFGTFQLNDGQNYFVTDKKLGLPEVQESVFKVARFPGVKTTGAIINERRASVTVVIVGSSRADLESKVDALLMALNQRQQRLAIHMLDGRYLVCDAISAPVTYRAIRLLAVTIQITFLAVDPYLYAANPSSYDSGSLAYSLVSGTNWTSGNLSVPSSGTEFAYPTITLTNNSQANNNTLAEPAAPAVNTTAGASTAAGATSITVASNAGLTGTGTIALDVSPGTANQETAIFNLPASGTGPYTLTVASTYNAGTLKNAHTSGDTIRSVAIQSGTAYTSIPLAAGLPAAVYAGQQFTLSYTDPVAGTKTQTVTVAANQAAGVTTLNVNSFTASTNFPAGATTVDYAAATITAFTLTQNPDGTALQVTGLSWAPGQQITIGCNPAQTNGYTIVSSAAPSTLIGFSGTFPVIEPNGTVLALQVTASTQPLVDVSATWTPRYLS